MKQIVASAGAPFGSLYHHFPGGKAELGADTLRWSGAIYAQLIDLFYGQGQDIVAATSAFFEAAADTVRDTDYADACPIATVALEVASTNEALRAASAEVIVTPAGSAGSPARSEGDAWAYSVSTGGSPNSANSSG